MKNLQAGVLIMLLCILVISIGVLITDKMATQVVMDTTTIETGLTYLGAPDANISLAKDDVTRIVSVINNSGSTIPGVNVTFRDGGTVSVVRLIGTWNSTGPFNITYHWNEDSVATTSLEGGRDAITTINTSWVSIIILIMVMAIIITMIIGSFSGFGNRGR